jgi:hypothetical protein
MKEYWIGFLLCWSIFTTFCLLIYIFITKWLIKKMFEIPEENKVEDK